MPGVDCNFMLTWADDEHPHLGEGISRTSDKTAPMYRVRVMFAGNRPMNELLRAADEQEAAKFAANRYPQATSITVLGVA